MRGVTLEMLRATGLPMEISGPAEDPGKAPRRAPGQMNKLERRYADYLESLRMGGVVRGWWFEAISLRIGHRCHWHPDFLVQWEDGRLELHDTKGWVRDDALVKAKAVASKFPFPVFHVSWTKRAWKIKRIVG